MHDATGDTAITVRPRPAVMASTRVRRQDEGDRPTYIVHPADQPPPDTEPGCPADCPRCHP